MADKSIGGRENLTRKLYRTLWWSLSALQREDLPVETKYDTSPLPTVDPKDRKKTAERAFIPSQTIDRLQTFGEIDMRHLLGKAPDIEPKIPRLRLSEVSVLVQAIRGLKED